jgi:hypothetical protein
MKRVVTFTAVMAFAALPLQAQDAQQGEGFSLMERGAQLFLEGIMREMEPALDDLQGMAKEFEPALRGFMQEMGPAFAELLKEIEDFTAYHPPEILPNGDIIIRRKTPAEMAIEPLEGEIEI